MEASTFGRLLLYLGIGLVVVGGIVLLLGRVLDLGGLPGDFSYEGERFRIYVPLTSMIVLSIVLTLILNLILRLFR